MTAEQFLETVQTYAEAHGIQLDLLVFLMPNGLQCAWQSDDNEAKQTEQVKQ